MARVQTIIVGGGISGIAPFDANGIPYVITVDPPAVSTASWLTVASPTGANRALVVADAGDPDPTGTEPLRVVGGIFSQHASYTGSVVVGQDQSVTGNYANGFVLFGRNITLTSGGGGNAVEPTIIGNDITITATTNANAIVAIGSNQSIVVTSIANGVYIGTAISSTGAGAPSVAIGASIVTSINGGGVVIGNGARLTGATATNCVSIGDTSECAANSSVAIGNGAQVASSSGGSSIAIGTSTSVSVGAGVAVGTGATITHANNVALGNSVTTFAARCGFFGMPSPNELQTIVLGGVRDTTNAAGTSLTLRLRNCVTGTDLAGGSITVATGLGTGAGAVSVFSVTTPTVLASGTTVQTGTERLRIDSGLGVAGNTGMMLWDVDNGTLERVTVGIADSGGLGFKLLRIPN